MSNSKKKKITGILLGVATLAAVAGSWAFYTSTNAIENEMKTGKYGTELVEKFTPSGDWQPGQEITKEAGVVNTGDYDVFVRVMMSETWTFMDGSELTIDSGDAAFNMPAGGGGIQVSVDDGLTEGDGSVVHKNLAISGWTFNEADGYWYYDEKLQPGMNTIDLLSSITLVDDVDMGLYEVTNYYTKKAEKPDNDRIGINAETGWMAFTGSVPNDATYTRSVSELRYPGYSDASYVLTITSEVLQATAEAYYEAGWSVPDRLKTAWGL